MGGLRVLIVDDEDAIREIARVALETVGGHEVTTASSGLDRPTPCCST